MKVEIVKRFHKDFKSAPVFVQKKVLEVVKVLEQAESLESSGLDCKRMEGQKKDENYFRIRVGDWRIGLEYIHPELVLLRLMSRGDVYKHFPPR